MMQEKFMSNVIRDLIETNFDRNLKNYSWQAQSRSGSRRSRNSHSSTRGRPTLRRTILEKPIISGKGQLEKDYQEKEKQSENRFSFSSSSSSESESIRLSIQSDLSSRHSQSKTSFQPQDQQQSSSILQSRYYQSDKNFFKWASQEKQVLSAKSSFLNKLRKPLSRSVSFERSYNQLSLNESDESLFNKPSSFNEPLFN